MITRIRLMKEFRWTPLFLGCLLAAPLLFGRADTAEVLGSVLDATGSPVPKANVTLTNQDTGIEAKTTTEENGSYDFFNVKIGRYSVTVEHPGFSKVSTSNVLVNVNARQRVDLTLQVGAVSESVEVTG